MDTDKNRNEIFQTHPLAPAVLAPSLFKRGGKAACGLRGESEFYLNISSRDSVCTNLW